MARLREFDEAKAITAVQNVFWEKGYEGTSYADLTTATGLGKGSLYAAFGNKRALYIKALSVYIEQEVSLAELLFAGIGPANGLSTSERVQHFLGLAIEAIEKRDDRRGCFLCNASVELAPHDGEIEDLVTAAHDRLTKGLTALFDENGDEKSRVKADRLLAVYLGMRVLAKAGSSIATLSAIREIELEHSFL
ncbi:MAG: TetR/AcrR family transcriptional regulator [Pseudomonadota bacterium]